MNLQPRIDSISGRLLALYHNAKADELEPFEILLDRIETDIDRYIEYIEEKR